MSKEQLVKCQLCAKKIGVGWKLQRFGGSPPLYLCDDCYDVLAGVIRCQFPGHMKDLADFAEDRKEWDEEGKFNYFELGAKGGEAK